MRSLHPAVNIPCTSPFFGRVIVTLWRKEFFILKEKSKANIKKLVTLSLLIALQIVLSRFLSLQAWNLKIGFGFVPVVIAATLFGPIEAAVVGGVSDLLGALIFPIGAYFPGFTFTAALIGVVFGLLLKNRPDFLKILLAVVISQGICGLLINTLWISILYKSPYFGVMVSRLAQIGIMTAAELIIVPIIVAAKDRICAAVKIS